MSNLGRVVYVVFCVDTEGPLYESLEARFERLSELYGITLPPSKDTFDRLRRQEIPLGGLEAEVARLFSDHRISYKDTWDKLDEMLDRILAAPFRNQLPDSRGGDWLYNWFCVDHIDYKNNPRRRDLGYHNIFDHYRSYLRMTESFQDGLHWHFHPMSVYQDAHRCATSYVNSPHLYETLCRRVIDRDWFPCAFRAGFQAERPDSNLFLEQWIPFDLTNMAVETTEGTPSADFANGRSGDWRTAPSDWSVYHPHHDDYRRVGGCRRWIARALNILNRIAPLTQEEVDKAFARASTGKPTLMGIASHDFREIAVEVEAIRAMLQCSSRRFPGVEFVYSEAKNAFVEVTKAELAQDTSPLELSCTLSGDDRSLFLEVKTRSGLVFGPQPFLAIRMKSGRYLHDNFDFDTLPGRWFYTFDRESILPQDLHTIGVAANDRFGNTFVQKLVL